MAAEVCATMLAVEGFALKRGNIMLRVSLPDDFVKAINAMPDGYFYKSRGGLDGPRFYINGRVQPHDVGPVTGHHVSYIMNVATLKNTNNDLAVQSLRHKFAVMASGYEQKFAVMCDGPKALKLWKKHESIVDEDDYVVVVLGVVPNAAMAQTRSELKDKLLPCFEKFANYSPHITIAYVRAEYADEVAAVVRNLLETIDMKIIRLGEVVVSYV